MTGLFITFEGGEGSGKTTQIAQLAARMQSRGRDVVTTREPGGTPGADALRHVVLSGAAEAFGPAMETILFTAARIDHVDRLIRPAIEAGTMVLCDRFHDSTRVYQGLAGVDPRLLAALETAALGNLQPDLTIILDIPATEGLERAAERRGRLAADRFEREGVELHEARRRAFLAIAAREAARCCVVDARGNVGDIAKEIAFIVEDRYESRRIARRRNVMGQGSRQQTQRPSP